MASCPACRRPVALARATCLYCGAALPPEALRAAVPSSAEPARETAVMGEPAAGRMDEGKGRQLLVLDLAGMTQGALARALGVPVYDAGLLVRRGGLHLHGVLEGPAARDEAARLRASGLTAFLAPEAEARVPPLRAVGGERDAGILALRTEEGPLVLRRGEVRLVVRAAITREHQISSKRRRVDTARLEPGYRVHLYRRDDPRAVEIDALAFEFGFAVTGSARLELDAWVGETFPDATLDDGFRRLPPALGPAEAAPGGLLAALGSTGRATRAGEEPTVVLDNVEQFRFYAGWRAAVERRR
jgi:hypothetical protein